jgi:hypothetical protein
MSEPNNAIDTTGRDLVDFIEKTKPVWFSSKYHDRILKSLQELDEAWQIRGSIPFHETAKELRRLIWLTFCEEFVSAKKAVRFMINDNEFWLVPGPKAAKFLRTQIPTISGTEMIELLLDHPPDAKTLNFIFDVKKDLSGKIETKLP